MIFLPFTKNSVLLRRFWQEDNSCRTKATGKLSEWSKEPHSKCGVRITSYRGFESLTIRKEKGRFVCLSLLKQANRSFFL